VMRVVPVLRSIEIYPVLYDLFLLYYQLLAVLALPITYPAGSQTQELPIDFRVWQPVIFEFGNQCQ